MPDLVQWLNSHNARRENVREVTIQIGRETFRGARYTEIREYSAGMDAVTRGQKRVGETYTEEFIFLLGEMPKSRQKTSRIAFNIPGDSRDWYVAGHTDSKCLAPPFAAYHPFGHTFMLAPWNVPSGESIDYYDLMDGKKPYRRISVSYTEGVAAEV